MTHNTVTDNSFTVHFWGVRGSIATPGKSTIRYGGNTPCIEMRCHGKELIFDAGTGIRNLGQHLLQEMPLEAYIFFTHTHWDHIQGFPFFTPAFVKGNTFHIHGKVSTNGVSTESCLSNQMLDPNFPVPLGIMGSTKYFRDLKFGETIDIGNDVTVETAKLNHPGDAMGYRVSWGDRAAVYATDTEHFSDRLDENLLHLARNADVFILDCTYTDEEYWSKNSPKVGWGHSTWEEGVKIAKAANVKRFVIFHHDPSHDDDFLDAVGEEVKKSFPNGVMAQEGMVITL